jgi:hypothetical protein
MAQEINDKGSKKTSAIVDEAEVEKLLAEDDDTLLSVLGLQAIGISGESAAASLDSLRADEFLLGDTPGLGRIRESKHLKSRGESFLHRWARELKTAVCGNDKLYEEERKNGLENIHLTVAAIIGAIVVSIPSLGALSGLLTVLGVLIAKSGLRAFCASLNEAK